VAHPDDEVLGCGASISKWVELGNSVHIIIMAEGITSRDLVRDKGNNRVELSLLEKSAQKAGKILGASSVKLYDFPDNRMDSVDLLDIVKVIEKEVESLKPHTVVTHHGGDLNIDHRIVHDAVSVSCRPQPETSVRRILALEVPSSTEWQLNGSSSIFHPNLFEDVSKTIDKKIEALKAYQSEMRIWPHARSIISIKNMANYRGSSVGCDSAEAFMLLREVN